MKQYAASPILQALIDDWAENFGPDWQDQLYSIVWDVDTAQGFGLDIWGEIVVASRQLTVPASSKYFGYNTSTSTQSWEPFNSATFYSGTGDTQTYVLADNAYRVLILAKALSNISATDSKSLNQVLMQLFPNRGTAYVNDLGGMGMRFVFNFTLESWEKAVLTNGSVIPRPAGVLAYIFEAPASSFGFAEAGANSLPFNNGTFLSEGAISYVT